MKNLGTPQGHDDKLVICATARLAQYLKTQAVSKLAEGVSKVFVTLNTVTVGQWLDLIFQEATLRGLTVGFETGVRVLDAYQERVLWENVISRNLGAQAATFFDVSNLAKSAMEAHQLAVTWEIVVDADRMSEESQRFHDWQQMFYRECEALRCIDSARWQRTLIEYFEHLAPNLNLPANVVFAGFSRINPQENKLRQVLIRLKLLGDDWELKLNEDQSSQTSHSYPDVCGETLAAALWAQERLQRMPDGQFAIVVPDLAGNRDLLQDTLEDVLVPSAVYPGQSESPRPFNISLGLSLVHFPLVETALELLQLMTYSQRVDQTAVSALLRCANWSDVARESSARALLETELRKQVSPAAPLQRFLQDIERQMALGGKLAQHLAAPCLVSHLKAMLTYAEQAKQGKLPSVWAQEIPQLLHAVGWLFERKLSSHEYQTKQAFFECVGVFGRLDALLGEVPFTEVSTHLMRMCQERTFQPQTEGKPRLQVLGLLEASGIDFDGMWVMGMQDSAWPPPARPNPLLPAEAQRKASAPNASAAVQLVFAQRLHEMLLKAAPEVVFSWARAAGASELSPSALIPETPDTNHFPAPVSSHWTIEAAKRGASMLEQPLDDHIAPLVSESERVRGGTWLLRAQAICPAWAYFQYRLGAVRLEEPVEGLDARKRGTFLHDSLEFFWKRVQTSDSLRAMTPEERSRLVSEAVAYVLSAHDADPKNEPLKPRLRSLERERLQRLIDGWLKVELERTHGFTVIANEREVNVDIKGIRFRMFVDRIDQLEDGSLLVIDYKTGASIDTDNWASDRLTEPQLPIYASIQPPSEGPVEGVIFAKVLMKDPTWAGLACQDKLLTKVMGLESKSGRKLFPQERFPDWGSVLRHWKQCVEGVAQEIRSGEAGVRFNNEADLRYCDVKPLLRLDERQAQLQTLQSVQADVHVTNGADA